MAKITYTDIEEAIADRFRAQLSGVKVIVEDEFLLANEEQPVVAIYLERREMAPDQYIRRRVDYHLIFTIWCWCFSMEGPYASAKLRDALVADVEELLLGERTFGMDAMIETSWIEGGELPTGRVPEISGFASGGEIRLVVKVNATSTEG